MFEFVKDNRLRFKDFIKIGVLLYPVSKGPYNKAFVTSFCLDTLKKS
jgi:hypothetical protein